MTTLTREQVTNKKSQIVTYWSPVSTSQVQDSIDLKHEQNFSLITDTLTTEQLFDMLSQLQETIRMLKAWQSVKSVKVQTPEFFDGAQSKLDHFLTWLDLYLCINQEQIILEANKVLFTSTYLTEFVFDWFEPILCDYQEHIHQMQDDNTQAIFESYREFKKQLEGIFGDINSMWNTARKLWQLWQTESASWLVTEFQQLIMHLDWDEEAYMTWFEEILKPEIQKRMIWMKQLQSLSKLFAQAVRIDNTLYDLRVGQ